MVEITYQRISNPLEDGSAFFAAPASSASAESLFFAAGKMHDDLKKSTTEETLEYMLRFRKFTPMLDFLSHSNLQKERKKSLTGGHVEAINSSCGV